MRALIAGPTCAIGQPMIRCPNQSHYTIHGEVARLRAQLDQRDWGFMHRLRWAVRKT
jgi:hypothetical protein